jgi:hypothetical protein
VAELARMLEDSMPVAFNMRVELDPVFRSRKQRSKPRFAIEQRQFADLGSASMTESDV